MEDQVYTRAVQHINECFSNAARLSKTRREQLLKVYDAVANFTTPKQSNWSTAFKINKAFQIVNEIVPDLTAKDPRWIVSVKNFKDFGIKSEPVDEKLPPEQQEIARKKQISEQISKAAEYAEVIEDYLTYIFDEYALMETVEDYAKNMVTDGKSYAEIVYKYEIARSPKQEKKPVLDELGQPVLDEEGQPKTTTINTIEEIVVGEYPTIDVIDWTECYYDPRYKQMRDRPYFIRIKEGVRYADLLRKSKDYVNLDKVEALSSLQDPNDSDYKTKVQAMTGVTVDTIEKVDKSALKLKYYYGFFNKTEGSTFDPKEEKLYKITTVNGLVVVQMKEIAQIPVEEAKCFPDTKMAFAVGFVEPIIALQDELNFKKNSASEYINKSLTRQVVWSPNSGIDPRTINDPVIITTKPGAEAMASFVELPHREINSSYFQETNDMERQIQGLSFRVDVAQPNSNQALTNTATGARIKFFESNKVRTAVRKRFERSLERLAYKLLQSTFENMDDNIVFKKTGTEEYWNIHKEVLRNVVAKYTIKIETNSSAFNDLESRRDETTGWFNLLLQAKKEGVDVDLAPALEEVAITFEKKDPTRYIKPPSIQSVIAGMTPGAQLGPDGQPLPQGTGAPVKLPPARPSGAAALTQQVAQGGMFKGM